MTLIIFNYNYSQKHRMTDIFFIFVCLVYIYHFFISYFNLTIKYNFNLLK